jgi:hypothetical protein
MPVLEREYLEEVGEPAEVRNGVVEALGGQVVQDLPGCGLALVRVQDESGPLRRSLEIPAGAEGADGVRAGGTELLRCGK